MARAGLSAQTRATATSAALQPMPVTTQARRRSSQRTTRTDPSTGQHVTKQRGSLHSSREAPTLGRSKPTIVRRSGRTGGTVASGAGAGCASDPQTGSSPRGQRECITGGRASCPAGSAVGFNSYLIPDQDGRGEMHSSRCADAPRNTSDWSAEAIPERHVLEELRVQRLARKRCARKLFHPTTGTLAVSICSANGCRTSRDGVRTGRRGCSLWWFVHAERYAGKRRREGLNSIPFLHILLRLGNPFCPGSHRFGSVSHPRRYRSRHDIPPGTVSSTPGMVSHPARYPQARLRDGQACSRKGRNVSDRHTGRLGIVREAQHVA
jgi:hypothetical protein